MGFPSIDYPEICGIYCPHIHTIISSERGTWRGDIIPDVGPIGCLGKGAGLWAVGSNWGPCENWFAQ